MELVKCENCGKESPASLGYCHFCGHIPGDEIKEPLKKSKKK